MEINQELIEQLAKEKLSGYKILNVEIHSSESGAFYGAITHTKHDGFSFQTGFVFFPPNHLSLTSTLSDINDRYMYALYKHESKQINNN